ncbi:MAG: hypothetical protein IPF73_16140 [Betaproteobacteria bacterium]|nr:hypothetical protein [Betaproteobacteria bacterium]
MLVALFKTNAGAFDGSNMNRLRSGAIITMPAAEEAGATPAQEAARRARAGVRLARLSRPHRRVRAQGRRHRPRGRRQDRHRGRGEDAGRAAGRDQLQVFRQAAAGQGGGRRGGRGARPGASRERRCVSPLSRRRSRTCSRPSQLKSTSMAQVQAQADVATGKAAPAPLPPPGAGRAGAGAQPRHRRPGPGRPPGAAAEGRAAEGRAGEGRAAQGRSAEGRAAEGRGAEGPKRRPRRRPPVPPPKPAEPSFLDDLFANVSPWAIGGGALAILAGIAALVAMRRRKTTKFEDSIISGTDIKTNTVFGSTGGGVVNTGDNSLATDFSREGLGNIDTDEVDPIAEAEVYLAYGRDAQAEEILKDALKKDPQRQEIYLKLLEIHAQHNKPSAFETVAAELFSVSQGQGETWQKAVALGRQLDPSNPMFAERAGRPAAAAAGAARHVHGEQRLQARGAEGRQGLRPRTRRGNLARAVVGSGAQADGRHVRRRHDHPPAEVASDVGRHEGRGGWRPRRRGAAACRRGDGAAAAQAAPTRSTCRRQGRARRSQVRPRLPSRRVREAGADEA